MIFKQNSNLLTVTQTFNSYKIVENSTFRFIIENDKSEDNLLQIPFFLHAREFRIRFLIVYDLIFFLVLCCIFKTRSIVQFVQAPVGDYVKFFQISPGDYFFSTLKISFYIACLFGIPFAILQLILFFLPGMTNKEKVYVIPLFWFSVGLFYLGGKFSYSVLAPAALTFFLTYGSGIIEPFLSFDEYFEFMFTLFYSTGFIFQIPILQIVLGLLRIISVKQMLQAWRYIIFLSTILSAILTPSTDPITQLFLSTAIMALYLSGVGILIIIRKKFNINL